MVPTDRTPTGASHTPGATDEDPLDVLDREVHWAVTEITRLRREVARLREAEEDRDAICDALRERARAAGNPGHWDTCPSEMMGVLTDQRDEAQRDVARLREENERHPSESLWVYPEGIDVARDCRVTLMEHGGVMVSASPGVDALRETEERIKESEEWQALLKEARRRLRRDAE